MFWVTVDGLEQHWEKATVDAEIKDSKTIEVKTTNVNAFTVEMPVVKSPINELINPTFIIDGKRLKVDISHKGREWTAHFLKAGKYWVSTKEVGWQEARVRGIIFSDRYKMITVEPKTKKGEREKVVLLDKQKSLLKSNGLQGPIDDAFMNRFIFVRPTGKASSEAIAAWVNAELNRAIQQWRAQFRGEAIVKNDNEITAEDIANSILILWGDVSSNKTLERIADKLPIKWNANNIQVGKQNYSSSQHIPILIYPNPLNPNRYIVLNSGFTFREADILTNAKQTAKLPDWAIIDISTPPTVYKVGKVVNAGFFGERWKLK